MRIVVCCEKFYDIPEIHEIEKVSVKESDDSLTILFEKANGESGFCARIQTSDIEKQLNAMQEYMCLVSVLMNKGSVNLCCLGEPECPLSDAWTVERFC